MFKKLYARDNRVQIIEQKLNDNGYLVIRCTFARTGIQERYGAEISPDFEASKLYKEYRSPDEVFKPEVLKGFQHVVITNDHPKEQLDTQNTRFHSIGFVSSEVSIIDNTHLECWITIYDADAIEDIQNGKVELSAGYLYSLLMAENEEYDYLQIDIIPNHIAIVQAGRCGSSCSIAFDKSTPIQGNRMKVIFKRMLPDGSDETIKEIDVPDDTASVVQDVADIIYDKSKAMVDASKAQDEEIDTLKEEVKVKDTELEAKSTALDKLQAKIDTQTKPLANDAKAIQTLAMDLAAVMLVATDCGIKTEAKDATALKKEVICKVQPDLALDGKSDEYIASAYDMIALQIKAADTCYLEALKFTPSSAQDEATKASTIAKSTFSSKYGGN